MGYYTNYKLTVLQGEREIDSAILPSFDTRKMYFDSFSVQDLIENNADSCKWYEHDEEMIELSKEYPDYLFVLDGDGEETGDVWREFYKNGKTYEWKAVIKRPNYNGSLG